MTHRLATLALLLLAAAAPAREADGYVPPALVRLEAAGDMKGLIGECEAAVQSFGEVRFLEPSENTALARRAQERLDQLRFGRGLSALRSGGGCG